MHSGQLCGLDVTLWRPSSSSSVATSIWHRPPLSGRSSALTDVYLRSSSRSVSMSDLDAPKLVGRACSSRPPWLSTTAGETGGNGVREEGQVAHIHVYGQHNGAACRDRKCNTWLRSPQPLTSDDVPAVSHRLGRVLGPRLACPLRASCKMSRPVREVVLYPSSKLSSATFCHVVLTSVSS
jgi:hypothetical protein